VFCGEVCDACFAFLVEVAAGGDGGGGALRGIRGKARGCDIG